VLKNTPAAAANLGITTIRGGEIQSLVKTDFLVNQGRVFTLGGGEIALISQYGNIDAGRGAKTSVSAPPPLITTDAKGNTVVDISASISGSGIATLSTGPSVPRSSVFAVAPRGFFDAGDAGVRSTGDIEFISPIVFNGNNVAAAGAVSGVKTADSSSIAGAAPPASAAPATKADTFAKPPALDGNAAANLTVELLGYGAADGQQSVIQDGQNASPAEPDEKDRK
jgi:hypothetical protein